MIEAKKIIKSGQEQAVASWINYLNQVRLDRLMEVLQKEELNLNEAMSTISETLKTISRDIVNNGKGRGGQYGMHGFIAEVAECGIGNAREQIEGKAPIYEWINDNGPEDLRRGATLIQQKFVNGGGHLSLQAIRMHLNAYPDFLDNGGVYQIPEDHYEKIKWLLSISEKEANKMPTSTGDFSLKQWREVHEFFKNGDIPLDKVEPSKLKYSEVQKGTYEQTFSKEKSSLRKRNQERNEQAYNKSKPMLSEGAKATAAAAAIEGAMALCMGIAEKRKSGKKFNAFDENDWKEIAATTGKGTLKGGIRGASIYTLTNFTATPAAVATLPLRVNFVLEEFCNLPTFSDLLPMITAARSRNIRLHLVIQSYGQLVEKYGENAAKAILDNCGNLIYLHSREMQFLRYISDLAGRNEYGRPLLSTSRLQRLSKNETLIFHDRCYPILVENIPLIFEYPIVLGTLIPEKTNENELVAPLSDLDFIDNEWS